MEIWNEKTRIRMTGWYVCRPLEVSRYRHFYNMTWNYSAVLYRGFFPKIKEEPIDYGDLEASIKNSCLEMNIEDVPGFVMKCIQLYETTVVRHGLMLVGPTGSGKTKVVLCYYLFVTWIVTIIWMYVLVKWAYIRIVLSFFISFEPFLIFPLMPYPLLIIFSCITLKYASNWYWYLILKQNWTLFDL